MRQSCFLFVVVATIFFMGFPSDVPVEAIAATQSGGVIGKSQNCSVENASWPVPPNVNPKCYRCFCKDGVVRCERTPKCENLLFCPVVVYNETKDPCCPRKCKSCDYLGQEYSNDEQWLSSQDSCRMLTCKSGVVTMARMQCVTLCPNPETLVGYCCPLCPRESVKNSSILSTSERELMKDPCVQCSCTERWCHCFKTACPALDCASDQQFTPSGRCCPECKKSRNDIPSLPNRCTFQGVLYKNEHNFRPDECTLCKCQDGTVICRRFVCPILDCPRQRIHYEPDLCCPRCRDTDPLPCDHKGIQYKHSDQWSPDSCTRCKCSNGAVRCDWMKCTELQCPRGYRATQIAGKCCPECEETDATCTVFGDPHYQTFDGRSFNFQGTCRYVLTKVCQTNVEKDLPIFTVIVQNEPRGNDQYAWTRHVSVRLPNGVRVALLPGKKVRLNRKPLRLPHVEIEKGIFSVTFDRQNNVLLRIGKDLKIVWDGNSYVEVTLSKRYKNRVCGLCGNYNNDSKDDSENADGNSGSSVYAFGQSWRIGSRKSCKSDRDRQYHEKVEREKKRLRHKQRRLDNGGSTAAAFLNIGGVGVGDSGRSLSRFGGDYEIENGRFFVLDRRRIKTLNNNDNGRIEDFLKLLPAKDEQRNETKEPDDRRGNRQQQHKKKRHQLRKICVGGSVKWRTRRESIEHCRLLKSPLFARCHSVVPVNRYFRSCIMDSCACPPSGRCYCESLLAYARRCEKEDVLIDWRSHSSCSLSGDSKCAIQGAVFSPCAPTCSRTCSTISKDDNRNSTISISCPPPSTVDPCTPGCYCPDGTAQLMNQCVPIDLCPQSIG